MHMINLNDTIAAISTAASNSGIGIVRISGEDAFGIIKKIFKPMNREKDISQAKSHTVHYGYIMDGEDVVDEVLALIMRAPHTYTKEDTVEIDCHGGMFVLNRVLELVLRSGARAAEPGEFTKRAFLNGRIDLSQAEAVIDVINAENDNALQSAITQLKGSVSAKIRNERAVLLEQIAYIEAALDDPEHFDLEGYGETLLPVLEGCRMEIDNLIATADDGRIIKEGIKTVILGKPNVGKSSLLNAMLGADRAIVTDIAGTTRDVLEERIRIGDITLNMIDTAGNRKTWDIIEKIGVNKAKDYAESADLVVFVVDSSRPFDDDDREISDIIKDKKTIIILNKQDLQPALDKEELEKFSGCPIIEMSITENMGLDILAETIKKMFYNREIDFNNQVYITNARHKAALVFASDSILKAIESIEAGMPEDFLTIDLMAAYESLGQVTGETLEDDLADEIFSKFCMGK